MNNRLRNEVDAHLRAYTNGTGSTIAAGTPVVIGDRYGIVHEDILDTASGTAYTRGQFELAKQTGVAFAQGDRVYWNAGNARLELWTPDIGGPWMVCSEGALSAATTAEVDLEVQPTGAYDFRDAHTVTSGEAAANSGNGRADIDTGFGVAPTGFSVQVIDASSGAQNTGYVVSALTGGDLGKVRIDGVAAGVQLDENDVIHLIAWR